MTALLITGVVLAVISNTALAGLYVASAIVGFDVPAGAAAPLVALGQLGMVFIGKERFQQSDAAFRKYSSRPPKLGPVAMVAALALCSCGGSMPSPDYPVLRAAANEMRSDVAVLADTLTEANVYIDLACFRLGDSSLTCSALNDGYEIARGFVGGAIMAIDYYEATGVGAQDAERVIEKLAETIGSFEGLLKLAKERAYGAMGSRQESARDVVAPSAVSAPQESGSASSEGRDQAPAAAP